MLRFCATVISGFDLHPHASIHPFQLDLTALSILVDFITFLVVLSRSILLLLVFAFSALAPCVLWAVARPQLVLDRYFLRVTRYDDIFKT